MGNSSMSPEYPQAYLLLREEWVILVHHVSSTLLKTICSCQLGVARYFGTVLYGKKEKESVGQQHSVTLQILLL